LNTSPSRCSSTGTTSTLLVLVTVSTKTANTSCSALGELLKID